MMKKNDQKLIVVLGMHRSGTSAVTRSLQVMGVGLGERMIPPSEEVNAKGFWEDVDINAFNSEVLKAIDSDWFYLAPIEANHVNRLRIGGYLLRAVELLRKKINGTSIFAFKDPRVAKLLPFWREVFNHCQLNVNYVVSLRHPLSVVKSLAKRDGFVAEHSYLLWLGHVLESLIGSAGRPRLVVDYDLLMQAPDDELQRIATEFNLEIDQVELQNYKTDFLDQGLRHTEYASSELLLDTACPSVVREVYNALLQAASNQFPLDDYELQSQISRWSDEFERLRTSLVLADKLLFQKVTAIKNEADLAEQISTLSQAVTERDGQISSLNQVVTELDDQVTYLNQAVADARRELAQVLASKSWRITKPLRFARRVAFSQPYVATRRLLSDNSRALWQALPISYKSKRAIKDRLFKAFPWVFRWSKAYQAWNAFNAPVNFGSMISTQERQPREIRNDYVPLLKASPLKQKPVKLICFYLPQFHVIPENDEWWGEGFTEWTNVQPAQPQFHGHHQPHVPDELGYYNLLDPAVQRRQVELAKLYGIEGFCFYFYWFGGKRLLEAPTENYLYDKTLDLPFCLCWANENWSRRWDGLDSEILMEQQHSVEDDLAFIQHVARYMLDPRYIRINGKPLLLVYRPSLLPSAKDTASRWRDWCRANGVGEIYLAYTQSFDAVDPAKYGFDAAIEFPPNNSSPPIIKTGITPLNSDFNSSVYDFRVFEKRSYNYLTPHYKLFRSVCPSWDNTARRKNKGTIFLNSSPLLYQKWLINAIRYTHECFENKDEQIIFVNAWNEWAEGAHLEPDGRFGYSYLEATRMAQVRTSSHLINIENTMAVIIHVFYEDIFLEILERIKKINGIKLKFYVTAPHNQAVAVRKILESCGFPFFFMPVENRGRDVLPFLKIIRIMADEGIQYFLKIHTKKSTHRDDGDVWRNEIYNILINENNMKSAKLSFEKGGSTGIIGPVGHILPMSNYFGSNEKLIVPLANRIGYTKNEILKMNFVAGTMFYARTDALLPLLNIAINESDFEIENGQIDGTLAHAIERVIGISCVSSGFDIIDANFIKTTSSLFAFADPEINFK